MIANNSYACKSNQIKTGRAHSFSTSMVLQIGQSVGRSVYLENNTTSWDARLGFDRYFFRTKCAKTFFFNTEPLDPNIHKNMLINVQNILTLSKFRFQNIASYSLH